MKFFSARVEAHKEYLMKVERTRAMRATSDGRVIPYWGRASVLRLAPPWLIGLVGRQQPHDQPNQLASRQDNGSLVLVLAHLVILAIIISRIVGVAHPDGVSGLTEVVTEITIARAGQPRFLGLETSRLMLFH
jgi:hypothetical protein